MRHVLLAFFLTLSCLVSAQLNGKYTFRHMDQEDGLLHTKVSGITEDDKGYIWILTVNGLQRYDGHRLILYPQAVRQSSLSEIDGSSLVFDPSEKYVGIYGLNEIKRLVTGQDTLITLSIFDFFKKEKNPPCLYPLANGQKWMIGESGVVIYSKDSSTPLFTYLNPGYNRGFHTIKDPHTGKFWVSTSNHLAIADPSTCTLQLNTDEDPQHPLFKALKEKLGIQLELRYMHLDKDENLWITSWTDYLIHYNLKTTECFVYSLKKIKDEQTKGDQRKTTLLVNVVYEDSQGQIWIATDNLGLLRFDKTKNYFEYITSDEKISNGLRYSFRILTIFEDRNQNLWIGTDQGISIFNPYHDQIRSIRHLDGQEASLPRHDINDVIETPQGEILVATWGGGVTFFDEQWNFIRNVEFHENELENLVWSFVQNNDGTIWCGTQGGFIHIYDPVQHSFKTIRPPETGFYTIRTMTKDRGGNILLGLHSGRIVVWDFLEKKFYPYNETRETLQSPFLPVMDMIVDASNRCWATHEADFKEFDIHQKKYTSNYTLIRNKNNIWKRGQGLEVYNDSILLVGTVYGGLQQFNTHTRQLSYFLKETELQVASVYAVKKDNEGNVWFTTDFSLYKWSPDHPLVQYNLDRSCLQQGLTASRFYALRDGRWVTSSYGEIICFDPEKLSQQDTVHLHVEISNFKVNAHDMSIDTFLDHHRAVTLPYNQNFFTIEFATLHFMDPRQIHYYYRLSDVDKEWIDCGTRQFADYTDLQPGSYVFEVKADMGNGPSGITSLPITIRPPWWGTLLFRLSCILALGFIIYFLFRKRIQIIRHESELKNQIAQTEMMALRSQMNPHFIFNCLNSIDNLIQTNQKEKATTYLAKFAQLIRAILENSKSNVIPCWKDLEALQLYLDMEALRWDNKINCQLHIDPQIQRGDYKIPPMILQPFVENAIHHGLLNKTDADKNLDIQVDLEGEKIKYTILDNGVGRTKAAEYKKVNRSSQLSYGMQITKDRISLFNRNPNQSIKITDLYNGAQEAAGTKVEVWLTTQS